MLVLPIRCVGDEEVHIPLLGVEHGENGTEEPEAVLDDVAAQVEAALDSVPFILSVHILVVHVFGDGVVVGADPEGIPLLALHPAGAVVSDQFAVEGVSAGTGDNADDTTHGPAVLGLVTGGLNLDLFDHLEGGALGGLTGVEARRVHTVDVEHVLGTGGAVDGGSAQPGLVVDAGDGGDQGFEVSSLGKGGEDLFGQNAATGGALNVDEGHLGCNDDLFLHLAELHGNADGQSLLRVEGDVFPGNGGEALQGEGDLVGSWGDPQKPVFPVLIGNGGSGAHHGGA